MKIKQDICFNEKSKHLVKRITPFLLLGFFLLSISSALSSEIYKWSDKEGKIHYSDTPPPPGVDSEIKKFEEPQPKEKPKPKTIPPQPKLDASPPSRAETATKKPQPEPTVIQKPRVQTISPNSKSELFREKRSYESINVIMYMTSWWGYCRKAREVLQALNVNLVEYNIEKDRGKREEMLQKSGGSRGVPLIDIEGIIIRGFSQSAMKEAIEKRRSL